MTTHRTNSSGTVTGVAIRTFAAVVTALATVITCATASHAATPAPQVRLIHHTTAHRAPTSVTVVGCRKVAPTSPDGYAAMFAAVDGNTWGAGDTALTVALPGRSVWLYSDTASGPDPQHWTRFVHNTAIVQTAGCLRVANSGGQILPNDPTSGDYYWIDSASAIDSTHLRLLGYEMDPATQATTGQFRAATVAVTAAGDLMFQGWQGYVPAPAATGLVKDDGLMGNSVSLNGTVIADNLLTPPTAEYTYSPQLHRELRLANGQTLLSLAVGWTSGTPTWQDMRPRYYAVTV